MFALFLSCAGKLEELIIEVTFKVRHGGKSKEAKAKVLYESCSTELLCIYKDPLIEGSVCGNDLLYLEGIALRHYCA